MQRIAMVLGLVVLSLLAGCRGGPPVRVFPPELSVQELRTAGDGEWTVVLRLRNFSTLPMRFSAWGRALHRAASPTLGQHNAQILREELGLSDAEIQALRDAKVIGERPAFA